MSEINVTLPPPRVAGAHPDGVSWWTPSFTQLSIVSRPDGVRHCRVFQSGELAFSFDLPPDAARHLANLLVNPPTKLGEVAS